MSQLRELVDRIVNVFRQGPEAEPQAQGRAAQEPPSNRHDLAEQEAPWDAAAAPESTGDDAAEPESEWEDAAEPASEWEDAAEPASEEREGESDAQKSRGYPPS